MEDHWGDESAVYVDVLPPIPSPPAAVTLSGGSASGTVSWNSVSGATSYQVYVSRWNNGSNTTVIPWTQDTSSPFSFSFNVSDDYHAAVKACNAGGCSAGRDSSPYWVALGPRVASLFIFGPAPVYRSDYQGHYVWIIGEIYNPEAASQEVKFRISATGHPSGCSQLGVSEPVLPGSDQTWLYPGEMKWVLYRVRYECHSPAPPGTYPMPMQLCVRHVSSGFVDNCKGETKQFIVR